MFSGGASKSGNSFACAVLQNLATHSHVFGRCFKQNLALWCDPVAPYHYFVWTVLGEATHDSVRIGSVLNLWLMATHSLMLSWAFGFIVCWRPLSQCTPSHSWQHSLSGRQQNQFQWTSIMMVCHFSFWLFVCLCCVALYFLHIVPAFGTMDEIADVQEASATEYKVAKRFGQSPTCSRLHTHVLTSVTWQAEAVKKRWVAHAKHVMQLPFWSRHPCSIGCQSFAGEQHRATMMGRFVRQKGPGRPGMCSTHWVSLWAWLMNVMLVVIRVDCACLICERSFLAATENIESFSYVMAKLQIPLPKL